MRLRHRALVAVNDVISAQGWVVDRTEAWRLRQILQEHGVDAVLDVGAAKGEYATSLRQVGFTGSITSFEPRSDAYEVLVASAVGDPHWQTENIALGAGDAEVDMNVAANGYSSSLLPMLEQHERSAPHATYVGTERVRLTSLDSWIAERGGIDPRRTLLKLDCQGYEGEILAGATRLLPQLRAVQVEISLVPLYAGSLTMVETMTRLGEAGLVPAGLEPAFRDPASQRLLQVDGLFVRLD